MPGKLAGHVLPFEDWMAHAYKNYHTSYLGQIQYYDVISYLASQFGKENVKVLLYEQFVKNKKDYIKELTDFLGIDSSSALEMVEGKHDHSSQSTKVDKRYSIFASKFSGFTHLIPFKRIIKKIMISLEISNC